MNTKNKIPFIVNILKPIMNIYLQYYSTYDIFQHHNLLNDPVLLN